LAVIFQFCIPCETYIAPDEYRCTLLDPFKEETNCTFEKRGAAWMAFLHEGVMVERLCFQMLRPTQVSRWTCTMDVMFFQLSMPMKFSETCGHYIVIFLFLHISSMHVMLVPVNFFNVSL